MFQSPDDGDHKVRCAIGNGLRADIWEDFCERFKVTRMFELYGASEGEVGIVNLNGKVGSCGRLSLFVSI